jgi:hypothetical protein
VSKESGSMRIQGAGGVRRLASGLRETVPVDLASAPESLARFPYKRI